MAELWSSRRTNIRRRQVKQEVNKKEECEVIAEKLLVGAAVQPMAVKVEASERAADAQRHRQETFTWTLPPVRSNSDPTSQQGLNRAISCPPSPAPNVLPQMMPFPMLMPPPPATYPYYNTISPVSNVTYVAPQPRSKAKAKRALVGPVPRGKRKLSLKAAAPGSKANEQSHPQAHSHSPTQQLYEAPQINMISAPPQAYTDPAQEYVANANQQGYPSPMYAMPPRTPYAIMQPYYYGPGHSMMDMYAHANSPARYAFQRRFSDPQHQDLQAPQMSYPTAPNAWDQPPQLAHTQYTPQMATYGHQHMGGGLYQQPSMISSTGLPSPMPVTNADSFSARGMQTQTAQPVYTPNSHHSGANGLTSYAAMHGSDVTPLDLESVAHLDNSIDPNLLMPCPSAGITNETFADKMSSASTSMDPSYYQENPQEYMRGLPSAGLLSAAPLTPSWRTGFGQV